MERPPGSRPARPRPRPCRPPRRPTRLRSSAKSWPGRRGSDWVALRLAELYARSDRATAALHVLDMCLRERPPVPAAEAAAEAEAQAKAQAEGAGGAPPASPAVLWEAGVLAQRIGRFEA